LTLARKGLGYTQPSAEVRDRLRPEYAGNADSLTMASHVVAVHFQTVAAANIIGSRDIREKLRNKAKSDF